MEQSLTENMHYIIKGLRDVSKFTSVSFWLAMDVAAEGCGEFHVPVHLCGLLNRLFPACCLGA